MTTKDKAKHANGEQSAWTMNLDGTYRLTGRGADLQQEIDIPAQVPGQVHLDLLREGIISDPLWRMQAEDCQWVEKRDWTYERTFDLPDDLELDWVELEFAGLDTFAEIKLNGTNIAHTRNMFIPHCFEVSNILRAGKNHLSVKFDSIWKHVEEKSSDLMCAFDDYERLYTRRMQCTFHWDWVNRFVTAGIWQSVSLRAFSAARINNIFARTTELSGLDTSAQTAESATLELDIETEVRVDSQFSAQVRITDCDGACVWQTKQEFSGKAAETHNIKNLNMLIDRPQLWWPAGLGDQALYECHVNLFDQDGILLDSSSVTFGIRTVKIHQVEDAPGSREEQQTQELRKLYLTLERNGSRPGKSFKLFVNEVEVFCKGGNWVPADPFPARITPGQYEHLIKMLSESNQNMLRCWGGGIYEKPAFWDACNRYGIMICQDFMMACGQYPENDPEFLADLEDEVPTAIKMLRNHPSLVWWYGDNENRMGFPDDDPKQWGEAINTNIIIPALEKLDPSREFFPSSPFCGNINNSPTMGDCHVSYNPGGDCYIKCDPQDKEDPFANGLIDYQAGIAATTGRFISEIQSFGSPAISTLRRFMTEDDIASRDNSIMKYHTKDSPYQDIMALEGQLRKIELLFGTPRSAEQEIAFQEYLQYEWVRLTVESQRRKRFYCGGVLFWMYNDCWPANSWSLIDYYGFPKASWYAMKRVCMPVIASIHDAGDKFELWVCSDTIAPVSGKAVLSIQPWQGIPTWQKEFTVSNIVNDSVLIATISKSEIATLGRDAVLSCELITDQGCDRAWHYIGMPYEMNPAPAVLQVNRKTDTSIEIATDNYARVVTLSGDNLMFSDNYFDILPGQNRLIHIESKTGDTAGEVTVHCWNMPDN